MAANKPNPFTGKLGNIKAVAAPGTVAKGATLFTKGGVLTSPGKAKAKFSVKTGGGAGGRAAPKGLGFVGHTGKLFLLSVLPPLQRGTFWFPAFSCCCGVGWLVPAPALSHVTPCRWCGMVCQVRVAACLFMAWGATVAVAVCLAQLISLLVPRACALSPIHCHDDAIVGKHRARARTAISKTKPGTSRFVSMHVPSHDQGSCQCPSNAHACMPLHCMSMRA